MSTPHVYCKSTYLRPLSSKGIGSGIQSMFNLLFVYFTVFTTTYNRTGINLANIASCGARSLLQGKLMRFNAYMVLRRLLPILVLEGMRDGSSMFVYICTSCAYNFKLNTTLSLEPSSSGWYNLLTNFACPLGIVCTSLKVMQMFCIINIRLWITLITPKKSN